MHRKQYVQTSHGWGDHLITLKEELVVEVGGNEGDAAARPCRSPLTILTFILRAMGSRSCV